MTDSEFPASPLEKFVHSVRSERLESVLDGRTQSLTIVLDRVRNYHNVSAVLRSADAFGVSELHLIGEIFEFSTGISMGSERWLKLNTYDSGPAAVRVLKDDGFRLVMLQPENDPRRPAHIQSLPVTQLPFDQKLALVFGNELGGVSTELAEAVDLHAFIPMTGFVESLNISVACAIALFCSTLAPAAAQRRTQTLGENERRELKNEWLKRSVRNGEAILREIERRNSETQGGS